MANVNGSSFFTFFLFFFFIFLLLDRRVICMGETSNHLSSLILSREELVQDAGYGEEKLSSVLVTGTLLCDACHGHGAQVHTSAVAGALLGVTCKTGGKRTRLSWARGSTDKYGDFIVDLPSHLHAIPKLDESCMIRVLRLPKTSPCRRIFSRRARGIRLSSVGNGIRTYTSGTIRLQRREDPYFMCWKEEGYTSELGRSW